MSYPFLSPEISVSQIKNQCKAAIELFSKKIDKIEKLSEEELGFESTFLAFENAEADFTEAILMPLFLKSVSTRKAIREASQSLSLEIDAFSLSVYNRDALYKNLKTVSLQPEVRKLEAVDQKLIEEVLRDFNRSGMNLGPAKRKKLMDLETQLSEYQMEYSKNLAEHSDVLECAKEDLTGVDEGFLKSLERTPHGNYKVTLSYPHYFSVMENAKKASTRKALHRKFFMRGGRKNLNLFKKALRVKQDIAQLKKYPNRAAYILEDRMARNPSQVKDFLKDLKAQFLPRVKAEQKTLLHLKQQDQPKAKNLEEWDWRYYLNQLKKNTFSVDDEKIKEYFPLDQVLKGMFDIYQTLFGVQFLKQKRTHAWHRDVLAYEIRNQSSKRSVATFYMDLFPRKNKYGHAAAFTLKPGRLDPKSKNYVKPIACIVANFTPPTRSRPSLLTHKEVNTLFHEFGHIMHQTLTEAKYQRFSGTSVARDFVEAPSQMLEHWVWEKEPLKMISGHYKNPKEKLPDELLTSLLAAKNVGAGLHYTRQLTFALIDQHYHTRKNVNVLETWKKIQKSTFGIEVPPGSLKPASFAHIMGGYEASYYGYLWAEVYAADMFTRFEKSGLFNAKVGKEYRNWILAKGSMDEPGRLLKHFLGRKPSSQAFMKSLR